MSNLIIPASLVELLIKHSPQLRDDPSGITVDAYLSDSGIDSLELLSLTADVEQTYDIEIDNADLAVSVTIGDLVALIDGGARSKTE